MSFGCKVFFLLLVNIIPPPIAHLQTLHTCASATTTTTTNCDTFFIFGSELLDRLRNVFLFYILIPLYTHAHSTIILQYYPHLPALPPLPKPKARYDSIHVSITT